MNTTRVAEIGLIESEVTISAGNRRMEAILSIPRGAKAAVAFAHGSGSAGGVLETSTSRKCFKTQESRLCRSISQGRRSLPLRPVIPLRFGTIAVHRRLAPSGLTEGRLQPADQARTARYE